MTIGDMIVFYSYLGYLITPLRRFAELNVTYARTIAGIERVYEILDTPPDIIEKQDAIPLNPQSGMDISFNHVVFQDTILFSGTIAENLLYGKPDASPEEMEAAAKAANAYDFIMKTPNGRDTMLGERGIGLSGGQKQRLSIARVLEIPGF